MGSHLLFALTRDGKRVRALKRKSSNLEIVRSVFNHYDVTQGNTFFEAIEWVEGDVNDLYGLDDALEEGGVALLALIGLDLA